MLAGLVEEGPIAILDHNVFGQVAQPVLTECAFKVRQARPDGSPLRAPLLRCPNPLHNFGVMQVLLGCGDDFKETMGHACQAIYLALVGEFEGSEMKVAVWRPFVVGVFYYELHVCLRLV